MFRQELRYRANADGVLFPYVRTRLNPNYSYVYKYTENIAVPSMLSAVTMLIYDENNRYIGTDTFFSGHFVVNESRKSIYEEC